MEQQNIIIINLAHFILFYIQQHIEPYLVSMSDVERERSVTALKVVLDFYLQNLTDVSGVSRCSVKFYVFISWYYTLEPGPQGYTQQW